MCELFPRRDYPRVVLLDLHWPDGDLHSLGCDPFDLWSIQDQARVIWKDAIHSAQNFPDSTTNNHLPKNGQRCQRVLE